MPKELSKIYYIASALFVGVVTQIVVIGILWNAGMIPGLFDDYQPIDNSEAPSAIFWVFLNFFGWIAATMTLQLVLRNCTDFNNGREYLIHLAYQCIRSFFLLGFLSYIQGHYNTDALIGFAAFDWASATTTLWFMIAKSLCLCCGRCCKKKQHPHYVLLNAAYSENPLNYSKVNV